MAKVADYIAEFLEQKKIKHVFGIIGSGNAQIFDAIFRRGYTEIICTHHEQAAVMAAGSYYRTNGVISAALVTTGAGSSNAITGVINLHMDSLPCLIISGNENSKFTTSENPLRGWGIQGYDSSGMVKTSTKYSSRVMDKEAILEELEKGYFISSDARPGPIWIDVPMNIQAAEVDFNLIKKFTPPQKLFFEPTDKVKNFEFAISETQKLLAASQRPVLWLGHGIRLAGAQDQLGEFLNKAKIPALVSWAGIDMVDSDHRYVYGRAGVYGGRAANFILQNSDLVIAIGTRLAIPQIGYEINELARAAKFVVVDRDHDELAKLKEKITLPICADAKLYLDELNKINLNSNFTPWIQECDGFRERFPVIGPEHKDKDGFINSYPFMEKLCDYMRDDEHIVTDMGTALLSGHQVIKTKKRQRLMTSTGLGEMGFGLPGAIGISIARNNGEVLCLNCDGGMMMNLQELQTIRHHNLPIKIIIFNNDGYLMIKHTQSALFKGRYSAVDKKSGVTCPDYKKIATAFDMPSYQIRTWDDFHEIIPKVLSEKGPTLCEVFMHPEQPLVPKLSLVPQADGSYLSPPLEDLSPLLPRRVVKEAMKIGMHPKSEKILEER